MKYRQVSRQKAEKPDDVCNTKNDKPTSESEKFENKSRKIRSESVAALPPCHDVVASVEKSTKRTDCQTANEQSSFEGELSKACPSSTCMYHYNNVTSLRMMNACRTRRVLETTRSLKQRSHFSYAARA